MRFQTPGQAPRRDSLGFPRGRGRLAAGAEPAERGSGAWTYLDETGFSAEQLAGRFAIAFDDVVIDPSNDLVIPSDSGLFPERSREAALAEIRAALWTSENPYDQVAGFEDWIDRAARGDGDALYVVQFWARSRRPIGPAGCTRSRDHTLARAILLAAERADSVHPELVEALTEMAYLPLLDAGEACATLEEKAGIAAVAQCVASLTKIDTTDREARAVFEQAKLNGDVF